MTEYTTDKLTGGTPSADSVTQGAAANACDNNTGTKWETANVALPHWWKYDFGAGVTHRIEKLRIYPYAYGGNCEIKDFTLQGSNNDSDWDIVFTGTVANSESWQDFTFSNSGSYRYYKVNITTIYRTDVTTAGVREFEMMEAIYRSGIMNWWFMKEAWDRHKKLWTRDKKLLLPKDLGFSY